LKRLLEPYFQDAKLSRLPKRPDFVFCATDLTHGSLFEFSRTRTGSAKFECPDGPSNWSLAKAVVASACFPPWFAPVKVSGNLVDAGRVKAPASKQPTPRSKGVTELSDGGLYDNLGLQHAMSSSAAQILVSDASAPLDESRMPAPGYTRLMRYASVTGRQARKLRLALFEERVARNDFDGVCWDIGAYDGVHDDRGYSEAVIDGCISIVRTDLDHFTKKERQVLENHGYWSAEGQFCRPEIRSRLAGIVDPDAREARAPHEDMMDVVAVCSALRMSHKQRSLRRIVRGMAVASASQRATLAPSHSGGLAGKRAEIAP
jgi:hypothetical protein